MGGGRKSFEASPLPEGCYLKVHLPRGGGYGLELPMRFFACLGSQTDVSLHDA